MTDISSSFTPAVEVLFFDGFDDLDSIAPLEILAAAGFPVRAVRIPSHPTTAHRTIAHPTAAHSTAAPPTTVSSAHGLRIVIDDEISGAPDLLVIPGGGWRDESPVGVRPLCTSELPSRLARLHDTGTVLASVCTGAMLLAAAGLLTGRPAVTNRIALDDLERSGADVRRDARVVDDGSVVTCGGPAAGIDLALRLVERFHGTAAATEAAERLEHEPVGLVLVTGAVAS